mgnify:FL=1
MPSVIQGCIPKEDIISGDSHEDTFAANLTRVINREEGYFYADPEKFFKNTYPTDGLKTTVREICGRLSEERSGSSVIKLETGLGGGKTHTLIALYHLAKYGSNIFGADNIVGNMEFDPMRVAAIVGTKMAVGSQSKKRRTIWGEIAYQLKGEEGYEIVKGSDQDMLSPGEDALNELIGADKCLILIDEIALYLARSSGITIGEEGGTNLAEATITFLQELTQLSSSNNNVALVMTSLDEQSVFRERTSQLKSMLERETEEEEIKQNIRDAKQVVARIVQSLEPTKGEEFAHIIRHRLFDSIDKSVKDQVLYAYMEGYKRDGVSEQLPHLVKNPEYLEVMDKSYPFHPEIINILRTKTSSIENFHKTRGVLRLLSLLVKDVWTKRLDTPMIHPYHLDFSNSEIYNELIHRLDKSELSPAIAEDLYNKDQETRAEKVDQKYSKPYGTWITSTILLHSLTGILGTDVKKGANPAELKHSMYQPGMDIEVVNRALEDLDEKWFYFDRQGQNYMCGLQPRLNKIIEDAKDQVERTKVQEEIDKYIRNVFKVKEYFKEVELFADGPDKVPDNTDGVKLVLIHHDEARLRFGETEPPKLVEEIFSKTGTQGKPRSYINSLVFLVADKERITHMDVNARKLLALRQLITDYESGSSYLSNLSKNQQEKLKQQREKAELDLAVAVITAYKHLIIPTSQAALYDQPGKRPLRIISMRDNDHDVQLRRTSGKDEEKRIVEFLVNQEVAKTSNDPQLSPDRIMDSMWKSTTATMNGDEFKKMFYKLPVAGIHFSHELIRKSMKDGVRDGKWYAVAGGELFDKENWQSFIPNFNVDVTLTTVSSDEGKKLRSQFYCDKCGNRKSECTCIEKQEEPPEEDGGGGIDLPPIEPDLDFDVEDKLTLQRIKEKLYSHVTDKKIDEARKIVFEPENRSGLSILSRSLVQFRTKTDVRYEIIGEMSDPQQDFHYKIEYKGGEDGYNKLKGAIVDFMPDREFDFGRIKVVVDFIEGVDAGKLVNVLGEHISAFTGSNRYGVKVYFEEE